MTWFCLTCGTELEYDAVARFWWCPKCHPSYTQSELPAYTVMEEKDKVCESYVEGFKDGYNRAMAPIVTGKQIGRAHV